jgi:hypothetical protein
MQLEFIHCFIIQWRLSEDYSFQLYLQNESKQKGITK